MYHVDKRGEEIELRVDDVDLEGVFTDSLLALADLFSAAAAASGEPVTHEVELERDERRELFAAWIRELLRLAEREDFLPERVVKLRLAGSALRATVAGERSLPRSLVRGVAAQGTTIAELGDRTWEASVVLEAEAEGDR